MQSEQLTIKQTTTGYWVVEQGAVQLAGAMTRSAAEAERDLVCNLRSRSLRRISRAFPRSPRRETTGARAAEH